MTKKEILKELERAWKEEQAIAWKISNWEENQARAWEEDLENEVLYGDHSSIVEDLRDERRKETQLFPF